MRAAFLVLAYHQPGHLGHLARALDCDWPTTLVHVDRKVPIEPFAAALDGTGARLLEEERRVAVGWGGFSHKFGERDSAALRRRVQEELLGE